MKSFAGKTVLVTGGTAGIGLAVCELFSSLGASVACMARHRSEKFFSVCADVSDEQSVRRATAEVAEKFGGIDVLVCNAGFGISGSAECTAAEDVLRLFEVNFLGVHNAVRAALPLYARQGRAHNNDKFGGCAAAHTLPVLLFGKQGGSLVVQRRSEKRGRALRRKGVRRAAR